jgi:hypothetical protein
MVRIDSTRHAAKISRGHGTFGSNPSQTYLWGRRIQGKPNCQGVYQRACSGGYFRRDRPFQDRKYNRRLCISIFPYLSPIHPLPNPPPSRGRESLPAGWQRWGALLLLFQYFIIIESFDVILVLALLLNQKGEEIPEIFILVLFV